MIDEFDLDPSKFLVVYAGNFGAAQGADIVIKAAMELQDYKDIQFVIFGGGPYFEDAREQAKNLDNIFIHELMPQDRISEVYSLGDIALITCKKGTGKAGMPSKTWSIMACNTFIIAAFDIGSELDFILSSANAGICIEPENSKKLRDSIIEYKARSHYDEKIARNYVIEHASKDVCVKKYLDVFEQVYK